MSEAMVLFPGSLIDQKTSTRAYRGLFLKEIQPKYKHTVEKLQDHLGLMDGNKTSPAEATAGSLLLVLADQLVRGQEEAEQATETLHNLFSIQDGETPEETFGRILEFVVERQRNKG